MSAGAVVELNTGPSLILRAVWFVFIGSWLSGRAMLAAWLLGITVGRPAIRLRDPLCGDRFCG